MPEVAQASRAAVVRQRRGAHLRRDRAHAPGRCAREVRRRARAGGHRRAAVRAQAPRPGRRLDDARLGLPARRAADGVGTGHPRAPAGVLQPADRRGRTGGGRRHPAFGRLCPADARRLRDGWSRRPTSRSKRTSTGASWRTWPRCTPRSGRAEATATSSPRCTGTWSCPRGWPAPRRPSGPGIWCPAWSARAGRGWPRSRPPRRRSSSRWPTTRARWWRRSTPRRTRSCTATGS